MAQGGGRPYARFFSGQNRGRGRGRGGARGRGRGNGRGGRGGAHQQRNGFKTTRVEESKNLSDSEDLSQEEEDEVDARSPIDPDGPESMSEDEETVPRQSYAALLQVLNATHRGTEPARKRRKLDPATQDEQKTSAKPTSDGDPLTDDSEIIQAEEDVLEEDVEAQGVNGVDEIDAPDSDDEDVILHDPFEKHYVSVEEQALKEAITARKQRKIKTSVLEDRLRKQTITYTTSVETTVPIRSSKDLRLKKRLQQSGDVVVSLLSAEEKDLIGEIAGYRDIQYGYRTLGSASRLRDLTCLHALNHVFKTRDRILKNNAKLSQLEADESLDLRDQGFTRPKVLIIVPTKQACFRFIESIVKISEPDQQENKARFWETFSQGDDEAWQNKPEDFQELFGGNHEEDFRVGLKFTRKTIKYFSSFYTSDIICGSALGLMRTITTGGGGKNKKGHDADFLSSIELVVVDHAAAIQMQNFQHLEYVFSQLNQLPKESHGCDFGRVREWYLDGNAKHLRQTTIFTSYHTPEINSLVSNHTHNTAGLSKYTPHYPGAILSLPSNLSTYNTIPQKFLRFTATTPQSDSDARFKFFTTTILPSLLLRSSSSKSSSSASSGTLLFVPTYFDFVRLRNHFSTSHETTSLSFGSVSEYTPIKETTRARSHFSTGRHSLLLYSERAHHHFRYRIRGVKRVIFYGVPENPTFWSEVLGFLGLNGRDGDGDGDGQVESRKVVKGGGAGVVRALFSRWDVLKLERIVGTERVSRLVNSDGGGDVFEFV